jgi:aryl-alcohol dehydrogenase-like predicted oxidoreductase
LKYAKLGRSGVSVSRIALGTATFGVAPREEDAIRLVHAALDTGVNYIDCANTYGNQQRFDRPGAPAYDQRPSAEEILGSALIGKRQNVIISSKVMEPVGTGPNDRGLSRRHIMQQVERSLSRLRTDYIDLYYMHHADADTPIDQTLRAFDDLVRQGKIRYPALSTFNGWRMTEALWAADKFNLNAPVVNQVQYSLDARGVEAEVLPAARQFGLSIVAFSPLAGGLLANPPGSNREWSGKKRFGGAGFTPAQLELASKLDLIARESAIPHAHLSLGWLLAQPAVACAIVGAESLDELVAAVQGSEADIPAELLDRISALGGPAPR